MNRPLPAFRTCPLRPEPRIKSPTAPRPVAFCIGLLGVVLGGLLSIESAAHGGGAAPAGMLELPRLGSIPRIGTTPADRGAATNELLDRLVTFKGWVNFPPEAGRIEIFVGCDGDGEPGNGILQVRTFAPSSETATVDGRTVWRFKTAFRPFRTAKNLGPQLGRWCEEPWQDGGTARLLVFARLTNGDSAELIYQDRDGVGVRFHDLILSDPESTPISQRHYTEPLYPVPAVLGKKNQTGTTAQTDTYYASVRIAPDGTSNPESTIATALNTLPAFHARYFDSLASCNMNGSLVVHDPPAVYFNKGDLGIGRRMHCSYNPCTLETACYVENFGGLDGQGNAIPVFGDDPAPSRKALNANKPFATVAMVSRGQMGETDADKVLFVVYGANAAITNEAPLDNVGHNTFIPGNCLVCHGAQALFVAGRVFHAHFLPFDLEHAFGYYSGKASNPRSRAAQEPLFRTLNLIVTKTDAYQKPDVNLIMNGFYGVGEGGSPVQWQEKFHDGFLPPSWNGSVDARRLYKKVVAPYCRTCHITHNSLTLGSFQNYVDNQFSIRDAVCKERGADIMPNAETTLRRFWHGDGRAQLVSRGNGPGCGLEP